MAAHRSLNSLALLVAGAFFMEYLDGTVIATAIPQMAVSFGVRPVDLGLGMSSYLITLAVLLPVSGWVAGRLGPRLVFTAALAGFTAASALCALSTGLTFFVAARVLQGAAGAMMVPVGRLAVLRTTPKQGLVRAIATLTWPALLAPIIAPPLGGFATTYASWRWVFLINLPVGLAGIAASLVLMPRAQEGSRLPLDVRGFLLTGLACLGLMTGAEAVTAKVVDWPLAAGGLVSGGLIGALAVVALRRTAHPLLDLAVLRVPSFAVSLGGGSVFRVAVSTVPFLLPLLFQVGFGDDAFTSGLTMLPLFVGNLVMKPFTTGIIRRWGFRTVLIVNGCLAAGTIAACAGLTTSTPAAVTAAILFAHGAARSMQLSTINTVAFADVGEGSMRDANTLFNTAQQISLGLGVVAGVLFLRVAAMLAPNGAGPATPQQFHLAFLMIGVAGLGAVLDALALAPDTGLAVSRGAA